jgi:hypothetical protein
MSSLLGSAGSDLALPPRPPNRRSHEQASSSLTAGAGATNIDGNGAPAGNGRGRRERAPNAHRYGRHSSAEYRVRPSRPKEAATARMLDGCRRNYMRFGCGCFGVAQRRSGATFGAACDG